MLFLLCRDGAVLRLYRHCITLRQPLPDEPLGVPRVGNFDECPTAETAVVVDGRHPQRARRGNLGRLVFLFLAGDFKDQIEQVFQPVPIVEASQEIGNVLPFLAVQRVGNGEVEVVVLDVADDNLGRRSS